MNALRRKLSDITNDDNGTPHRSKRRRNRSSSPDSQDEDVGSRANDTFVYQAGHKFFLVHGPWIHLGEDLFETEFDETYNAAERFENDESKAQGQLQKVWRLLCGKFEREALQQKCVHRAVRYFFILWLPTQPLKHTMQFMKGLKTERYNTASRVRNHCTAMLRRICSRTFSVRLHPSPSVSVCSRPFSALLSHSFLLSYPSPSLFVPSMSVLCFHHFRLILSAFHIRIRPVLVSSDLAFMQSLLLFGYNPYQPNPIVPRFLLSSVLYCLMIHSSLLFRYV